MQFIIQPMTDLLSTILPLAQTNPVGAALLFMGVVTVCSVLRK